MHKRFFHCQSFCPSISSPVEKKFGLISLPQEASASLFFVTTCSRYESFIQQILFPRCFIIATPQKTINISKTKSRCKIHHNSNILTSPKVGMRQIFCTLPSPRSVLQWLLKFIGAKRSCFCKLMCHLHGTKQNLPDTGISCHLSVFKDSLIISWHKDIFKDSLIIFWYKDIFLLPQKKDFFPPPTCVHAVPINYRMSEWLCVAQSGPTEKLLNWKSRQKAPLFLPLLLEWCCLWQKARPHPSLPNGHPVNIAPCLRCCLW